MKKIICIILSVLLSSSAFAESMSYEILDDDGNVKINIELPQEYEDKLVSLYVFNPLKSWADFEGAANGKDVIQHAFSGAYQEGLSTSFKINPDLFAKNVSPDFTAVLTSGDFQESMKFSLYSSAQIQSIVDEINSASPDTQTLFDRVAGAFGLYDFSLYNEVEDKTKTAEKLISIYKAKNEAATKENAGQTMKEAILLTLTENGKAVVSADGILNNDCVGADNAFSEECKNITAEGIAEINAKISGKVFQTLEDMKKELEKAIITGAVYNNNKLGHGHVAEIIERHGTYLEGNGLNLTAYNNSVKESVGRSLVSGGKKDFADMISAINSLSVSTQQSVQTSGGSTSGKGSSSSGVISTINPTVTQTQNKNDDIFIDINDAPWAKSYIESMYQKGIVSGKGDGYFYPNSTVTRAEYTKMIVDAFGIDGDGAEFADVSENDWFYPYINKGTNIIFGDGGKFYPNDNIKRQDIAVIALRALKEKGVELSDTGAEMTFSDKDMISDYAYEAVRLLNQQGVINGDENGYVNPMNHATRAEACVIISGVLKLTNPANIIKPSADDTPEENTGVSYNSKEIETLVRIGAMPQESAASLTSPVNRGQFAKMMAYYMNKENEASFSGQIFDDVDESHEYAKYISLMSAKGIMEAENQNNFEPDTLLAWETAVSGVTRAMGYFDNEFANAMQNASSLGLLKGIAKGSEDTVTSGEIAELFYNSLTLPTRKTVIAGDRLQAEEGESVLEEYYDLFSVSGIMNGNSVTAFRTSVQPSKGTVMIDSVKYDISDELAYMNDYIGYYMDVYYDEDGNIVHFEPLKNDEAVISDYGEISFDNGRIYYVDGNEKQKSLSVTGDDVIIYNGTKVDSFTADMFEIASGSIEIITPKGSDYKIIKLYKYETQIANGVSAENNKIYLKDSDEIINLEAYDYIILRNENAVSMSLSEIKDGSVLSIAESADKRAIIINVSTKSVSGNVSNVNTSERTITVDGEKYECTLSLDLSKITIGANAQISLDYKGRAAYAVSGASDMWRYAFLIDARYIEEEEAVRFKYLADDGAINTIVQTDEVWVDGADRKGAEVIEYLKYDMDMKKQTEMQPQVIKYRTNSDGELTKIDTAKKESNEDNTSLSLNADAYSKRRTYRADTRRITEHKNTLSHHGENNMYIGETTVAFQVPLTVEEIKTAKDSEFQVIPSSYFNSNHSMSYVWAYDTDYENGDLVGALLYKGADPKTDATYAAVKLLFVTRVMETIDDDNDMVKSLYGYDFSTNTWMSLEDGTDDELFNGVENGDVVRYVLDTSNKVSVLWHDFDKSTAQIGWGGTPGVEANMSSWSGAPQYDQAYGILTHKNGKWVNFAKSVNYDSEGNLERGKFTYDVTNTKVFLFNDKTSTFEAKDPSELTEYLYSVNNKARVYIYTSYGNLKIAIIHT